jgi:hypothetical protein
VGKDQSEQVEDEMSRRRAYEGIYQRFVPVILEAHGRGLSPREISQLCRQQARPTAWRHEAFFPSDAMVRHILRRLYPRTKSRPIDMGGPRNVWLVFTPAFNPIDDFWGDTT